MNFKLPVLIILIALGLSAATKEKSNKEKPIVTIPMKKQVEWQEAELGMIFHYDISIFSDRWERNNTVREGYDLKIWNPKSLDTDQWIQIAKEAGCKYAVITATHFQGFLNWQSDIYPYGMKQVPWKNGKGDIVAEFVQSCRKYGLKPGIYMSTHRNFFNQVDKHKVNWGNGGKEQYEFNQICERMVEELCTKYGELFELWFDAENKTPAEGGPDVLPIINKYQPNCIYYHSNEQRDHRWCGYADQGKLDDPNWARITGPDYTSLEKHELANMLHHGTEDGTYWSPAFSGLPMCYEWFYRPGEEFAKTQKPAERLIKAYKNTVGRNANLVLGATPNRDGLIPEWQKSVLLDFGKTIREMYGNPKKSTSGKGEQFVIAFKEPQKINYAIIKEKIKKGERVRNWKLEGLNKNGWIELVSAQSIGHKRIAEFKAQEFKKIRLTINESIATPLIELFSVGLTNDSIK